MQVRVTRPLTQRVISLTSDITNTKQPQLNSTVRIPYIISLDERQMFYLSKMGCEVTYAYIIVELTPIGLQFNYNQPFFSAQFGGRGEVVAYGLLRHDITPISSAATPFSPILYDRWERPLSHSGYKMLRSQDHLYRGFLIQQLYSELNDKGPTHDLHLFDGHQLNISGIAVDLAQNVIWSNHFSEMLWGLEC